MGDRAKETVIIVHGTWAAPKAGKTPWYQRAEAEGLAENFVSKLDRALQERGAPARCWAHAAAQSSTFYWSGENSWIARTRAASALADYITKLRKEGWRCHIIAHSHGGNALVEALPQMMAEPNFSDGVGKIVTLGTPFMDTVSPIRKKAERNDELLRGGAFFAIQFFSLIASVFFSKSKWGQSPLKKPRATAVQHSETLLAISCPTDEAWQILHHLPKIHDPIAPRSHLLRYLISSVQSTAFRLREAAYLQGARSYRDIGHVAKCIAAFVDLILISAIFTLIAWDERILAFLIVVGAFMTALIFAPFLGPAFYSAIWSPFRWVTRQLRSLADLGPALGTYLVRRASWAVLLKMVMGLEGYRFRRPPVRQFPYGLPRGFARYENIPQGAERRALQKRGAWIAGHLGDVSQTFTNLAVTAADITSLMRAIEADQTLVHAAYYVDDECVARVADWIAGRG
jgi:hypothetical protein